MNFNSIVLAYCLDNSNKVDEIQGQLSAAQMTFSHIYGNDNLEEATLAERLADTTDPVLLIISDNFLKSAQCMGLGIELLQKKSNQILPVVIDGIEKDDQTGEMKTVETNFDRVSDIIKYINYWQDQYLDLRRKKRQIENLDEKLYNARLKRLRDISSEVGEFLRLLRSMNHLTEEAFKANGFEQFFRFIDDSDAWKRFKSNQSIDTQTPTPSMVEETVSDPIKNDTEHEAAPIPEMELFRPPATEMETVTETDATVALAEELEVTTEAAPEAVEEQEVEADLEESIQEEIIAEITAPKEEEEEPVVPVDPGPQSKETIELVKEGLEHFEAGRIDEALVVMGQAVEQDPDDPKLRYHYALMLLKDNRDMGGAADQLRLVVEAEPDNIEALMLLGKIAEQNKDFALARWNYEKILEIDPEHKEVYSKIGNVILNHFEDQKEVAATYFQQAIKNNPENVAATYRYAKLLQDNGNNPEQAIQFYKKVIELKPGHAQAYLEVSRIYEQIGDLSMASEYYEQALAIDSDLRDDNLQNRIKMVVASPTPPPPLKEEIENEENTIELIKQNLLRLEVLLKEKKEEVVEEEEEVIPPPPPVKDIVVFISGATEAIGKAVAEKFADESFRILLNGSDADQLANLKNELETAYHTEVEIIPFDVRNRQDAAIAFGMLESPWQNVDILINYAGSTPIPTFGQGDNVGQWEQAIDTSVKSLLYLSRLISPKMISRQRGHIINIGSAPGSTAQYAVDSLTKSMAIDLKQHQVKVSQISLGDVRAEDIAEAIYFIATAPAGMNVQDLVLTGFDTAGKHSAMTSTEEEE